MLKMTDEEAYKTSVQEAVRLVTQELKKRVL
jgi:hypothetical protein